MTVHIRSYLSAYSGKPGDAGEAIYRSPVIPAGYETPKRIVFVSALPETVGGKVRKHELRGQLAAY